MKMTIVLVACIVVYLIAGCASAYKAMGLTSEQAAAAVDKDKAAAQKAGQEVRDALARVLAGEQVPMESAIDNARVTLWQAVSAAIGVVAAAGGAIMTKAIGTERKMSAALIAGVEKANPDNVKKSIAVQSIQRGVGVKLAARVRKLTTGSKA